LPERNVTYLASIIPVQAEGKRLAQVYVIDPTLNRAGWKAKREAIERAKTSLLKQPLLYEPGPNEKPDWIEADAPFWGGSHQGEWVQAGRPIHLTESPDGSYHVIYDITSDHAWQDIVNRRAKAASPSCEIYDAHLTKSRAGGLAELELSDLEFNHVLLLPPGSEGAYPNAGIEQFWETEASCSGFTSAVASALNQTGEGNVMSTEEESGNLDDAEEEELEELLDDVEVTELNDTEAEAAKWAQKAVKKPGRVRAYLESRGLIKKDAPIPISLLQSLFKKTKDRSLKAAFLLAIRFKKGLTKKGVVGGQAPEGQDSTKMRELLAETGRQDPTQHMRLGNTEDKGGIHMTEQEKTDSEKQLKESTPVTEKDVKIRELTKQLQEATMQLREAGLSLKAHEEGLGVVHLEAKFKDSELEKKRLATELANTKSYASLIEGAYRKVMISRLVSARLEGGVLKPDEVDMYVAESMRLPFDKLDERLAEAEKFAQAMRELGLGRRETYGAGAAMAPARKNVGYTVGDLSSSKGAD
jgi:predicted nucleic acid-binding protein